MPSNALKKRKIAVLGSPSVGKTSLVNRLVGQTFDEIYQPTLETSVEKTLVYDGVEYLCEIIDTAGQDQYAELKAKHAIGIHGYVLVYSITSRSSFEMVRVLYDKIIGYSGVTDVPCVVVGTKCDLRVNRTVDKIEAQRLCARQGWAFEETSAKRDINVAYVFELCLGEIEKQNRRKAARNNYDPPPPAGNRGRCITF